METREDVLAVLKQMDSDRRNLIAESDANFTQGFAKSGHRRQDEAGEIQAQIDEILGSSGDDIRSEFETYLDRLKY